VSESVATAFFGYVAQQFLGQAVVLENTDPPPYLVGASQVRFTKNPAAGRYGFFPHRPPAAR
jgi:hypothetical protein